MSTNFLFQSGDGSNKPEFLNSQQEAEMLQPEEDVKLTTASQVSLGMDWLSLDGTSQHPMVILVFVF